MDTLNSSLRPGGDVGIIMIYMTDLKAVIFMYIVLRPRENPGFEPDMVILISVDNSSHIYMHGNEL